MYIHKSKVIKTSQNLYEKPDVTVFTFLKVIKTSLQWSIEFVSKGLEETTNIKTYSALQSKITINMWIRFILFLALIKGVFTLGACVCLFEFGSGVHFSNKFPVLPHWLCFGSRCGIRKLDCPQMKLLCKMCFWCNTFYTVNVIQCNPTTSGHSAHWAVAELIWGEKNTHVMDTNSSAPLQIHFCWSSLLAKADIS